MNKPKILIPIHPQWCEKIFNGEKTIEVRKTVPKIDTPFEVLVYQTKIKFKVRNWQENFQSIVFTPNGGAEDGNGKVIGSFICDGIDHIHTLGFDDKMSKQTCLTFGELSRYLGGVNGMFYGWHITETKLFDRPKELSEFGTICKKHGDDRCNDCLYLRVCAYDDCIDTWCGVGNVKPLTRAPLSWIYVEEIE